MEKIDVLFYIISIFDKDNFIRYIPVSLENLEEEWDIEDILVLFDVSKAESNRIMTLLAKYVEVIQYEKK